jgi:hypothetical protein
LRFVELEAIVVEHRDAPERMAVLMLPTETFAHFLAALERHRTEGVFNV